MTEKSGIIRVWVVSLLLCALTGATYLPVTQHQFINYDDPVYVTDNPYVQAGLTLESVLWTFKTGRSGNWHPVTWLSLMLDSELYGDWPGGFHLTNLLLHIANTVLLFVLLRIMTGALWRSAFVAALFAVHPLHVESVAWVAERKDVLSTFFGLLTLLAYARYATTPDTQESIRRKYYFIALALFALALMSKPMLVTLPFVMLLLDYWPLHRVKLDKGGQLDITPKSDSERTASQPAAPGLHVQLVKLVFEKVPFFALTLLICIVTVLAQRQTDALASPRLIPITNRLAQMPVSYVRYLGKTFWPANLAVFYPYKLIGWDSPTPYITALVLLAMSVVALARARRWPYLLTGWFWFIGTLVPVIGLVQVGRQSIADRYTYIPLIGVFLVAAWWLARLVPGRHLLRHAVAAGCAAVVVASSFATRHQLRYWQNSKLLFQHALSVTKLNDVAHNNLGAALMAEGDIEGAQRNFEAALRINPEHREARMNLGFIMVQNGEVEEGLSLLRTVLEAWPTAKAHYNFGTALVETGNYADAVPYLQVAVKLRPDFFNAHMNLGTALTYLGRFEEALPHFVTAVKLQPNHPDAQFNLGAASAALGKLDQAAAALSKSVSLRPQDTKTRRLLVDIALKKQNLNAVITNLVEIVRVEPEATTAFDLARLLVQVGKADAAIQYYRIALDMKPDWHQAYNNLALILATHPDAQVRNGAEAVALAERACALTQSQVPVYLSTLAAAYAEAGRFNDAVRTAEQASALAEALGQTNLARRNAELLQLYRAGKPFHDQSLSPGAAVP